MHISKLTSSSSSRHITPISSRHLTPVSSPRSANTSQMKIKFTSSSPSSLSSFPKPKLLMCHICGREYGTASIEIHLENCKKIWEKREKLKLPNIQRAVPESPVSVPDKKSRRNLNSYNELVWQSFNQNVMLRCPNCFRTFLEDRIDVHLKSCTNKNPHKASPSIISSSSGEDIREYIKKSKIKLYDKPEENPEKPLVIPKSIMCHICGRDFGTASFDIHLKSCAKVWEEREMLKPPNKRKPVPELPKDLPIGTSRKVLQKRNEIVSEFFNRNVMAECPFCTRTFLEDRIEVHLKSCTAEHPHKPPTKSLSRFPEIKNCRPRDLTPKPYCKSQLDPLPRSFSKPLSVICHICGREYGTASIEIHIKNCEKIWEEREKLKPPGQRKMVPISPESLPVEKNCKNLAAYNEAACQSFNQNVMARCPNCLRYFLEDRLEVHLKSCSFDRPHKMSSRVLKSCEEELKQYIQNHNLKIYEIPEENENTIIRPMCHLCGREFGASFIDIHMKSCVKLWQDKESKKQLNKRKHHLAPDLPTGLTSKALERRNELAHKELLNSVMCRCPYCFQRVLEDRIEAHLRSCAKEKTQGKIPESFRLKSRHSSSDSDDLKHEHECRKPRSLMCYRCKKEIEVVSLGAHLKTCGTGSEEREGEKKEKEGMYVSNLQEVHG